MALRSGYGLLSKTAFRWTIIGKRNILSSAYYCEEVWKERLKSPILKNINMVEYFVQLEKKFNNKKKIFGVDIDIFANNTTEEDQLRELEHFIYRFRRTSYTIDAFDSTSHATIRAYMEFDCTETLLKILSDRINYGIFPDHYCYSMLMDKLLEQQNYRDAAKVATLMMIQEDFDHPISKRLALYSCHMYLREQLPEPWVLPEVPKTEDEDEEEVFVRVPYLVNPFFDDHFDIQEPKLLIGKTLYLVGKEFQDIVGRTYQLIGLGMYEKWEKASKFLDNILSATDPPVIHESGIIKFKEAINNISGDDGSKENWLTKLEPKLNKLTITSDANESDLHNLVIEKTLKEIPKFEEDDIQAQKELFKIWEQKRQDALDDQVQEFLKEDKIKLIETKKKELAEKEKLLFFFENWNKIEMEYEEVKQLKGETKEMEEEYIPPDVKQIPAPKS